MEDYKNKEYIVEDEIAPSDNENSKPVKYDKPIDIVIETTKEDKQWE